jgi:hypothetical protein
MLNVRDLSLAGNKKIRKTFLGASFALFLFLYGVIGIDTPTLFTAETAVADTNDLELTGYAFAENIGLISFNCSNTNSCGTGVGQSDYKVLYNEGAGTFSGFAWSDGIGWIKFHELSGFPFNDGYGEMIMDGNDSVHGWIRACAGTSDGLCGTMDDYEGGWDGWISLSGSNYGPSLDEENKLIGYSWGSDVVGWIDWSPFIPECEGPCGVQISEPFDFSTSAPTPVEIDFGETESVLVTITKLGGSNSELVTITASDTDGVTVTEPIGGCETDAADDSTCTVLMDISVDLDASYVKKVVNITGTSEGGLTKPYSIFVKVPQPEFVGEVSCSANRASAFVGQDVVWTAVISGGDAGDYTYSWSSPDGLLSGTEITTTVEYQTPGTKTAVVLVTDELTPAATDCDAYIQVQNEIIYEEY